MTTRLTLVPWLGLFVLAACDLAADGGIVAIEPADPRTGDDLEAVFEVDPDDAGSVTLTYAWSVDDAAAEAHTSSTVPASATARGERWSVVVTATSERGASVSFEADTVVQNTPPVVDTVSITPTTFDASSTLTAVATGSDADGDSLTWTYHWYVGTKPVQSGPTDTLSDGFVGGDTVRVEAVASDGTDDSASAGASATASNTAPSITGAHIEPLDPTSSDPLSCVADGESDVDGDTVTYTTTWTVDGKPAGTADVLPPKAFARDATVACTTTPSDGEDTGASASAPAVTIANSAPTVANIAISPDPFYTASTLTALYDAAFDMDGDATSVSHTWSVDGKIVSSGPTLDSSAHQRDSVVALTVTASDKTDSRVVVVTEITQNTPPAAPSVRLSCPDLGTDLICHVDSTDDDGDTLDYAITWTVDDKPWTGTAATTTVADDTILAAELSDGAVWACEATADDGLAASAASRSESQAKDWQGEVMRTDGTWTCAQYEVCGKGTACTAADAKAACAAVGLRVASHASDDNDDVASLGATESCNWSVSYYITEDKAAATDCLVGVSNLDWSSCCNPTRWHGNTLSFGEPGAVFGYVASGNSGLVSGYPNVSESNWGCLPVEWEAGLAGTCTDLYVACTE